MKIWYKLSIIAYVAAFINIGLHWVATFAGEKTKLGLILFIAWVLWGNICTLTGLLKDMKDET